MVNTLMCAISSILVLLSSLKALRVVMYFYKQHVAQRVVVQFNRFGGFYSILSCNLYKMPIFEYAQSLYILNAIFYI